MPDLITCAYCKKPPPSEGYFDVVRRNSQGAPAGTVSVCSLLCLVQWAYAFSVQRGVQMVASAKDVIDRVIGALKGPRA